jgi:hypothetical protein
MQATPPPPPAPDALAEEHAALDREEAEFMRLRVIAPLWLRENPGLFLSGIYVAASIIGVLYHFLFFRRFGVNVLEFSEASDFLMVVVREPLTVGLALLGVPFYLVYGALTTPLSRWSRRHFATLRSTPEKRRKFHERMRPWWPLMQGSFIGIYAILFVMLYSTWRAKQIRAGDFRKVAVEYKTDSPRPDGSLRVEGLGLLGTTARFVFLYDQTNRRTEVVPLDAISRLVWDARTRRERAADAAPASPAEPAVVPPAKPPAPAVAPPSTAPAKPGNP